MTNKLLTFALSTGTFFLLSFAKSNFPVEPSAVAVSVKAEVQQGIVSPNIMGFNIVYCYESDAAWQSGKGKVPEMVRALGTRQFRYPGGTVVTHYHWQNPTGQGWSDTWSADFDPSKSKDPSTFMDIDEYLEVVKAQKTEPLIGINMGSGMRYNRVKDGVAEAVALMKHCLAKGVKVKYYYLDNEPYQHDANFTFTPEQYAEAVNTYVPEMKKVDPDIKIIVNTHPNPDLYTKTLLTNAGRHIDFVDVHMYWKFKNATFDNWKKEGLMKHRGVRPYREQREIFEKMFKESGYPNIKLVILEWNIGPSGDGNLPPTESEAALMVSEQFTQYIQSGIFMATFWPLSWPSSAMRALLNAKEAYRPNKMYDMFALFKDVLGQQKVLCSSEEEGLINLAIKSTDGKTLWVYLINKKQDSDEILVNLNLSGFHARSFNGLLFNANDTSGAGLDMHTVKVAQAKQNNFSLKVSKNSFTKLTFKL